MPTIAADPNADVAARAEAIAAAAIAVLERELPPGFNLTCLNVGASGVSTVDDGRARGVRDGRRRRRRSGRGGGWGGGGDDSAAGLRRDERTRAPKVAKTVERAARERERGVGGRGGERIGAPEEPRERVSR